jgi:hypothetical protein
VWTGFVWLWTGTSEGSCEHGNEPSGSIKCLEISLLEQQLVASQERLCSMELVNVIILISRHLIFMH